MDGNGSMQHANARCQCSTFGLVSACIAVALLSVPSFVLGASIADGISISHRIPCPTPRRASLPTTNVGVDSESDVDSIVCSPATLTSRSHDRYVTPGLPLRVEFFAAPVSGPVDLQPPLRC
jgi:hypothetical protein